MLKIKRLFVIALLGFSVTVVSTAQENEEPTFTDKIKSDYKNFFSKESLKRKGKVFLVAGIMANTSIDENIRSWYQDDIRSQNTDDIAYDIKKLGEYEYLLSAALLASSAYLIDSDSKVGEWGANSFRAFAVGAPITVLMQKTIGASRPVTTSHSSDWRPFNDSYGVSGHSFIGAIPFITLAKMNKDNKAIKYSAYAASGLAAWSRINTDSHYTSQALLGWFMAYESVNAVFDTNNKYDITITPVAYTDGGVGLSFSKSW